MRAQSASDVEGPSGSSHKDKSKKQGLEDGITGGFSLLNSPGDLKSRPG